MLVSFLRVRCRLKENTTHMNYKVKLAYDETDFNRWADWRKETLKPVDIYFAITSQPCA